MLTWIHLKCLGLFLFFLGFHFPINHVYYGFFFFFLDHIHCIWKFPGQGSNPCHSSGKAESLTFWAMRKVVDFSVLKMKKEDGKNRLKYFGFPTSVSIHSICSPFKLYFLFISQFSYVLWNMPWLIASWVKYKYTPQAEGCSRP